MIYCMVASLPERESMLKNTVDSLRPQCDGIRVALNGYDHVPTFLNEGEYIMLDNSKGDAGKFYFTEQLKGYLLTCDDDLIYPADYVKYMTDAVYIYRCAVSLHGKTFPRPVISFGSPLANYRCLDDLNENGRVDIGGTGVMAWHSDFLKVRFEDFGSKNMADLWFAKLCHEQGVNIMCLAHAKGNLVYQRPAQTIWDEEKGKGFIEQTKLLKTFLK